MVVVSNETKRVRALTAVAEGAARSWTRGAGPDRLTFQLANPQTRVLHGVRVFSVECSVRRGTMVIYDDRVNMPNPATAILNAAGEPVDNPLEALRETLFDVVRATTDGFQRPRLERNPDNSFRGDTLAVRSSTADGAVAFTNASWTTTQNGPGDSVSTTGNILLHATLTVVPNYIIRQGFLDFDTSSLGASAVVSAAALTLYADAAGKTDTDTTTLEWYSYNWGGTLENADFRDCVPSTNITNLPKIAHIALSAWTDTANAANNLTADSGAVSSVNVTGTTYMVGLLNRAYGSAPTGANSVTFRSADFTGTTSDPLLTVTYTITYTQTLTGSITPTGALTKKAVHPVSGSVTPTGALSRAARTVLTSAITPTGSAISTRIQHAMLSGAVTSAGALTFAARQSLAGSSALAGAIVHAVRQTLTGSATPTGAAAQLKTQHQTLSGTVTLVGVVADRITKLLTGSIAATGAISHHFNTTVFTYLRARYAPVAAMVARYAPMGFFTGRHAPRSEMDARYAPRSDIEAP